MKKRHIASSGTKTKDMFFGLVVKKSKQYNKSDYKDLIASLFLSPQITSEHVKRYVKQLEDGTLSYNRLLKLAGNGVQQLVQYQLEGIVLSEVLHNKIQDWVNAFGEPSSADWTYLERTHGFSYHTLVGERVIVSPKISSAKEMANIVKQFVLGQDAAIERLSIPFFQHLQSYRTKTYCPIKTSVVLLGPTGVGKSEIYRQFGRLCNCPVIFINSNEMVPSAWRGNHLSDFILRAMKDCGYSLEQMEYSVIVFPEIDKITHHNQRIVGNNGTDMDNDMMRELMRLKETDQYILLEDGINTDCSSKSYRLSTNNLLVVFDGAFVGIEDVISKRLKLNKYIGFSLNQADSESKTSLLQQVNADDLINWGFMPELVGRIGDVIALNPLSADMIYKIMLQAKDNVLQSHIDYCHQYHVDLHFTSGALHLIADIAYKSGLGFRNVKTLLSKCLNAIYYELSDVPGKQNMRTVNIDQDYIAKQLNLFTK